MTATSVRNICIFCGAVVLMTVLVVGMWKDGAPAWDIPKSQDADGLRNERSTPRLTVLPSSPAISSANELQEKLGQQAALAKAVLSRLGYDVGEFTPIFDAKLRVALFRFQRARGVEATGDLDSQTATLLGLPSK